MEKHKGHTEIYWTKTNRNTVENIQQPWNEQQIPKDRQKN